MLPDWLRIELQEKWERLKEWLKLPGARTWVNAHPAAIVSVTAVSAVLLLVIVIVQLAGGGPPPVKTFEKEWYYDLNTGELFTAKKGLAPPIEAPSGPLPDGEAAGVRAYVLSYAREPNESERFIGLLETTAPKELMARMPARKGDVSAAMKWGRGKLICRVDDKRWVPADTRLGREIFDEAFAANENGERPTYCRPD